MRVFCKLFLLFFCLGSQATTLMNVEPIEVVERSAFVAHVQVLEAKYLELESPSSEISTCGTNVKAKVIFDYFGGEEKHVMFSTFDNIEVGSEYLIFLHEQDSKEWFNFEWNSFFIRDEDFDSLDKVTLQCLEMTRVLKSDSFPQRAIKIDFEGNLIFELNNMLIPKSVKIKLIGEGSIIQQYNQTLVEFKGFDLYLKELIRSNKSLKQDK
ncbi:MAG: hypothetical protein JXQ95_19975 [Alteromonas stellipolaris]|uniref:hypothetical protein n=1 Tax=Alteromonas stellipolaris TaxID=233316 RepID=UPI003B8D0530